MANKQTAVEWLLDQMFNKNKLKYERGIQYIMPELVEQAKAMEKEQIIDAINYGAERFGDISEQYYEETYGTQLPKE